VSNAYILHTVGGGDDITLVYETSSADKRIAATRFASLDFGIPWPRVGFSLGAADYSHVDVRLNARDATLAVVFTLRRVVVFVEQLHRHVFIK